MKKIETISNISFKKKKILSLIVFAAFYISNLFTGDNLIYPEYAKHPILSFLLSMLTIISFLLVTYVFFYSKKFVIIGSIYFLTVLSLVVWAIADGIELKSATVLFYLIVFSYSIPTEHFSRGICKVSEWFNIKVYATKDYMFFITFAVIVILFYTVYFIGKRKDKRI